MHFSRRLPTAGAGLIASLALLILAASAQGAVQMDYGDAPDGADARYSIAVLGKFPTLSASNGPRHSSSGPALGIGRDREEDSKQVDRDRFEDGVSLDRLRPCATSRLTVLIDTRKIPRRLLRGNDLYLNSWFDWDRSGTWGETNGCPGVEPLRNNEWSIVNQRISGKAFLKRRVRAYTFKFKGGLHSNEFWTRVTLTLGQKLPIDAAARSGGATATAYRYGETEDYLIQRSPGEPPEFPDDSGKGKKKEKKKEKEEKEAAGGPFRISCLPNPITVEHGRAATVRFFVNDEGKGPIFGRRLSPRSSGDYATRLLRHPNQRGVPNGYFRASGFRFKSKHRDARANPVERHVVRFSFSRGKVKQVLRCAVNVIHEKIVVAKKLHRPMPVPPPEAPVAPPPPEGEPPTVKALQAFYQQDSKSPSQFAIGVQFDQDVEGFRIKLDGLPTLQFTGVGSPGGLDCKVAPDGRSVLCTGSVKANTGVAFQVQFNLSPKPGALDGHLVLCAIQGGVEKGPFPMQETSAIVK